MNNAKTIAERLDQDPRQERHSVAARGQHLRIALGVTEGLLKDLTLQSRPFGRCRTAVRASREGQLPRLARSSSSREQDRRAMNEGEGDVSVAGTWREVAQGIDIDSKARIETVCKRRDR